MARIPTIVARESPLAGAPQSQASGEDFGAGIGRAVQGLGQTITQIGGAVESIGTQRQADADRLALANEMANTSYATNYNDTVDNYPDPSGAGLTGVTEENYDVYMNDKLAKTTLTGKAKQAYQLQLLEEKRIFLGRAAEQESTMRVNNAGMQSTAGLDNIINDVRSNGMVSDAEFANQLAKGEALLATQPHITAQGLADGRIKLSSDLATARFAALAESAVTELDVMKLQDELDTSVWGDRFTKQSFEQMKSHLQSTRNTVAEGTRVAITAGLNGLADRSANGIAIPDTELAGVRDLVTSAGNTATVQQLEKLRQIEIRNRVFKEYPNLSKAQQDAKMAAEINGVPSGSGQLGAFKLTYVNQKSTRSQPVTRQLGNLYHQAASAAGIDEVVVVSGGQPTASEGGKRTGSTRHDHGHAGDIQLKVGGRTLDMRNPDDLAKMYKFVQEAWRLGATGIGAGTSYMGTRTIHVGYGSKAVWGAGGASANAPRWLQEATSGVQSGGPIIDPALQAAGTKHRIAAHILDGMYFAESTRGTNVKTSTAGAQGPMQMLPSTFAAYARPGGDINNLEDSADAAAAYMADLLSPRYFNGNMTYALMAYNWGPGSVREWIKEGSDPNAIPQETADYVEKVMTQGGAGGDTPDYETGGGGGGAGYTTGGGGDSYGPVSGYSQEQFILMDAVSQLQSKANAAITVNVLDYERSVGTSVPGITLSSTPDEWLARGNQLLEMNAKHELTAAQMKPFLPEEMSQIANVMASGNQTQRAALLAGISAMPPEVQGYANEQIGETDKVAGAAGTVYARGDKELALQVLEGRGALKNMKEQGALEWQTLANENFTTNLNTMAIRGMKPADIDAIKGATDAALAQWMGATGQTLFDAAKHEELFYKILGAEVGNVNGMDTMLPEDETTGKPVEPAVIMEAVSAMGVDDWRMRSETRTPPLDKTLQPLEGWQLADAQFTAIDGDDNYRVTVDGQPVLAVDPATGKAQNFVLNMKADWLHDINNRTDKGYAPPDSEAAQSYWFQALYPDEEPAAPPTEVPDESLAVEPVSPPELPAQSGIDEFMRNPTANLRPQAIPPGGSVTKRKGKAVQPPAPTSVPAPASAGPPTPRLRQDTERAKQIKQRSGQMQLDAYTAIVKKMNISETLKTRMLEAFKRRLETGP